MRVVYLESGVFASLSRLRVCVCARARARESVLDLMEGWGQRHECICMSPILIFLQLLMITTSTDVSY